MTTDNTPLAPLYVSLTTLPSRIHLLRPTLDSLATQTRKPDGIFLCLPRWSVREQCAYDKPAWLAAYEPLVRVVESQEDYGPGTKILGCLPHLSAPCCLVIVDDDDIYRPFVLQILYERQMADTHASFSFCTYAPSLLCPGVGAFTLTIGKGADGFSFFSPNLAGIAQYAQKALQNPQLRVVDDVWISAFLAFKGVPLKGLAHELPPGQMTYEVSHLKNQLYQLTGEQERNLAERVGIQYLAENGMIRPVTPRLNVTVGRNLSFTQ